MSNQKKQLAFAMLMEFVSLISALMIPLLALGAAASGPSNAAGFLLVSACVLFCGCRVWCALNSIYIATISASQPARSRELPERRAS